ncbi:hypothetical protein B0G62_13027 [Paraburkholderia eburnea]|uniref:Uncharacterized protein n=1 Tax=Paraburkholderia eburnea TaxID=1189126 RepID=A0A2S4LTB7_9BURK|nr:hypothetical protein [Paraburkholderia eburnea]POR45701.1 hypothetical protein B0G62_13027 [Paraburkholderia eburnea]PRZ14486.1 hypothetical protein BX588_12827 [Paraburkholderia eburnea]
MTLPGFLSTAIEQGIYLVVGYVDITRSDHAAFSHPNSAIGIRRLHMGHEARDRSPITSNDDFYLSPRLDVLDQAGKAQASL